MATKENTTTALPVVPAAWLEEFGPEDDDYEVRMSDALSRFIRHVEGLANAVESHAEAPAQVRALGEVLSFKAEEMREWLDRWDGTRMAAHQRRKEGAGVNIDELIQRIRAGQRDEAKGQPDGESCTDDAALEALCNDVQELVQEQLMPCDAEGVALAFRAAADGDLSQAARVIGNVRKNVHRARGDVPETAPAAVFDGDDDDEAVIVRLESGTDGEDFADRLMNAVKVLGLLVEYAHDVALGPEAHAGTLTERVFRDASTASNQLLDLADRMAAAEPCQEVAA